MRYYPLFVNLENKACLVVGAGDVGQRKIRSLIEAGAGSVSIVETRPVDSNLAPLLASDNVIFHCREFTDQDLDGKFLVIACTSNEQVNRNICDLCDERGILCNIADQPEKSSFIVPATVKRGDLTIAVSTGGQSPAMAKRIRRKLQDDFGNEYALLLTIMGRIRPLILGLGLDTKANTAVFRALAHSDLLSVLKAHNLDAAREILEESLPDQLHANISELLDGLA